MNTEMNAAGHRAHKHQSPTTPAPHPATLSHPPKKELEPGGGTHAAPHESHVETRGARTDAGRATETCECLEVARKALGNDLPNGESK